MTEYAADDLVGAGIGVEKQLGANVAEKVGMDPQSCVSGFHKQEPAGEVMPPTERIERHAFSRACTGVAGALEQDESRCLGCCITWREGSARTRVSTDAQGASGLGLEAQREAVARYIVGKSGQLVGEFEEVESGKRNDRPKIAAALRTCRLKRAILVIAKLDRLARNVAFVSNLMESGVEFVACDNPHATRLTIHILAAVAEHEREMISQRTKAALAAAKARGTKLGNPHLQPGSRSSALLAVRARSRLADKHAADVLPYIAAAQKAGCISLAEIARALTARGIQTPSGQQIWAHYQVARIIARTSSSAR